jgi:hypothetical protein
VGGGLALFGAGYLGAVIGALVGSIASSVQTSQQGYSCLGPLTYGYIPVVGTGLVASHWIDGYVSDAAHGRLYDCYTGTTAVDAFAVADTAIQVGGLLLAAAGFVFRRQVLVRDDVGANMRVPDWFAIVPTSGSGTIGLALRWTNR